MHSPPSRPVSGHRRSIQEDTLMDSDIAARTASMIKGYTSSKPEVTASALRKYWLEFESKKGSELIRAEQRAQLAAVGIPIPILKAIGAEIAKAARKDVSGYVPLAQRLWDDYGREGRVVALLIF